MQTSQEAARLLSLIKTMFSTCIIKDKLDKLIIFDCNFFYGEVRPELDEKMPVLLYFPDSFLRKQDLRDICK
jgi:hypothetical protein